jgi:metal-responsive CopG/Arc/MetJ family transcriptional regulator
MRIPLLLTDMSKTVEVSITLEKELFEEIEKQRGLIPRSAFIEHELEQSLKKKK